MKSGLILGAVAFLYVARFGHCSDDKETKRPYKVFRFVPENLEALQFADRLYRSAADYKLDFWKSPKGVGIFVDVMVPPQYVDTFPTLLTQNNISYIVTIPDVAKLIEEREKPAEPDTSTKFIDILTSFFRSRKQDDRSTKALFNFGDYSTYPKITYWLQTIAFNYPSFTKTFKIGTTTEGRAIEGIKIGNPASSRDKKAVWIDGGIHAREWAAVHTALYIINELVSKYGYDPVVTHYVDSLNFYIVPCLNPDGYEYSRSDSSVPERRMWRKNRAKEKCGKDIWGRKACCGGVDLNRNFGFHWAESGSSDDPCSEVYQGTKEFSEPESRALRDMLLSPELNGKTDAYISFHTYAQMWMFPFGHQRNQVPDDVNDLRTVGREAVNALQSVFGTRYQLGTGADMLYPSSGGSDDWAKEKAKIKYTYLLELRPEESAYDGFLLEKSQLIPTGKETWAGVKKVIDAVLKKNHLEQNNRDSNNGGAGLLRQPQTTTMTPRTTKKWTTRSWTIRPWTVRPSTTRWAPRWTTIKSRGTSPSRRFRWRLTPTWGTRRPLMSPTRKPRTIVAAATTKATTAPTTITKTTAATTTVTAKPTNVAVITTTSTPHLIAPSAKSDSKKLACKNERNACDKWLSDSPTLCKTSFYMTVQCQKSCGVCS